jgi:hypothetical protein
MISARRRKELQEWQRSQTGPSKHDLRKLVNAAISAGLYEELLKRPPDTKEQRLADEKASTEYYKRLTQISPKTPSEFAYVAGIGDSPRNLEADELEGEFVAALDTQNRLSKELTAVHKDRLDAHATTLGAVRSVFPALCQSEHELIALLMAVTVDDKGRKKAMFAYKQIGRLRGTPGHAFWRCGAFSRVLSSAESWRAERQPGRNM